MKFELAQQQLRFDRWCLERTKDWFPDDPQQQKEKYVAWWGGYTADSIRYVFSNNLKAIIDYVNEQENKPKCG